GSGALTVAGLKVIRRLSWGEAEVQQAAHVFAEAALGLSAEDGIGARAVQAQAAGRVLLQGDLVGEPAARDFPDELAAGRAGVRVPVEEAIGIRALGPLAAGSGKRDRKDAVRIHG